ncbi:MAG TPA: hypothetical protein VFL57_17775 [Bryobacteraceae bacterium]|nr:hypothetical protein [Bryobacteraceae bacterium]
MASRGNAKGGQLRSWLDEHKPARIGDRELEQIRAALGRVSESYLRRLLRSCGVPLHPLIEGVVQADLPALARTLLALEQEYEAGDAQTRRRVRQLVITAKDHCRWTLRRFAEETERGREKREALLWMNTWLENPPVFREWLSMRQRSQQPDPRLEQ